MSELRRLAEREVKDDLAKTSIHLLEDIHEELLAGRSPEHNLLHAQKRLASLQVATEIKMTEATERTLLIAKISLIVSILSVIVSIVTLLNPVLART